MKKILAVVLSTMLAATMFAGCGSKPASSSAAPAPSSSTAPASSATPSETPSSSAAPVEKVKIRVAYHPNFGPLTIPAIETLQGFFEAEGLEVEWLKFTAGPPEIAAMASGDLQFGYIGHGAHTLCAQGQAEIISLSHLGNSEKILVRKNSGITSMKDLEGKVLATELGTSGEVILDLACQGTGMDRSKIKVTNMQMSGAVAAFIAGQVDAIAAWGTDVTNIYNNVTDELSVIAQTADFTDVATFPASWVATPEYVAANKDVTMRFIRALNKCYDYRAGNQDEIIEAAAKFSGLEAADLAKEKDQMIFIDTAKQKEMIESGELMNVYQKQLDYFIANAKVESGDINKYVRVDLMKEALGIS